MRTERIPVLEASTEKLHGIFPVAYGNEEESGIMDDITGSFDEPYTLVANLRDYVPSEVQSTNTSIVMFLRNGSKIYPGGIGNRSRATNLERATQECAQPSDLGLAIRAEELLLAKTAENYVKAESLNHEKRVTLRSQRRVVDSRGSRKACHDNFALERDAPFVSDFWGKAEAPPDLLAYAASKGIIDGAGYVREYGLHFSQKVGGLSSLYNYGYMGSMFRFSSSEGNPRIEVRHNDINISDWAIQVRVGGMALAIALSQTPLSSQLPRLAAEQAVRKTNAMNRLTLRDDGTIESNASLIRAINMQQATAELAMSRLCLYVDEVPEELLWAATERYRFCDDMRRVIAGDESIGLLSDRADWAGKLSLTLAGLQRDRAAGMTRSLTDMKSQFSDMRYDYKEFSAINGKLQKTKVGAGYKLRDKGQYRGRKYTDRQVNEAYRHPIPGTRAAIRGQLLERYHVTVCDWTGVLIRDDEQGYEFDLDEVTQTELSDLDKHRLNNIKRIR